MDVIFRLKETGEDIADILVLETGSEMLHRFLPRAGVFHEHRQHPHAELHELEEIHLVDRPINGDAGMHIGADALDEAADRLLILRGNAKELRFELMQIGI